MSDNLKVWDSFGKTDPTYTKSNGYGSNASTAITPMYMVKLATKTLGPIGEGWGYVVKEERFDNGKPVILVPGDKGKGTLPVYMLDNGSIVFEKIHTLLLEMWIKDKSNTFLQFGHTKYSYLTKNGDYYVDDEYGKKSLTDAMTKCLSLIGVCSDIYMGEFDDKNYQEVAKLESDLKKADDKDAEYKSKSDQFYDYIKDKIKAMGMCPDFTSMQSVYAMAAQKIDRESPILGINPADAKKELDAKYFELEAKFKGESNETV